MKIENCFGADQTPRMIDKDEEYTSVGRLPLWESEKVDTSLEDFRSAESDPSSEDSDMQGPPCDEDMRTKGPLSDTINREKRTQRSSAEDRIPATSQSTNKSSEADCEEHGSFKSSECDFGDDSSLGSFQEHELRDYETDLAAELNSLSVQQRQSVLHDVHCVSEVQEETPEFLEKACKELLKLIRRRRGTRKAKAYRMALSQSKEYVQQNKLLLMLLRACSFDAKKACKKIFLFFQYKLRLFGESNLSIDIQLRDLDANTMASLRSGCYQVLPVRDPASRATLVLHIPNLEYNNEDDALRAAFYSWMACLEDEDVQKKGVVLVITGLEAGFHGKFTSRLFGNVVKVFGSVPLRPACIHFCTENTTAGHLASWVSKLLPFDARIRRRVHRGTSHENAYSLMTFGIPANYLPVENAGNGTNEWHLEWLHSREKIEAGGGSSKSDNQDESTAASSSASSILLPTQFDVLFGRGRRCQTHPGNVRLHIALEELFEEYDMAFKSEKVKVSEKVLKKIHENGGRFLENVNGSWCVVDDHAARKKISHDFRSLRSLRAKGLRTTARKSKGHFSAMPTSQETFLAKRFRPGP